MSLNESIVEDAALEWFGDPPASLRRSTCGQALGYAVGHRAGQSRPLATLRDTPLPNLLSGELSVAGIASKLEASA